MPIKKSRRVQKENHIKYYDETAKFYDARYREEQFKKYDVVIEHIKTLREDIILDLGCGTGLLLEKMSRETRSIVGLDISKNMLKKAKCKIKNGFIVHLVLADADYMPLRDSYFDCVYAFTLLQNIPDPLCTLLEIRRITKSNAQIVVSGLSKHFTKLGFTLLLRKAKLRFKMLDDVEIKSLLAICMKMEHY